MNTQRADFAVTTKDGVVKNVGRTYIEQPEIKWNGKGIKWFDDSLLLKKKVIA